MSYKLDTAAAKKVGTGTRITETGEYVGKIEFVEDIVAGTGTKGVTIGFKSDAGESAELSLYTVKADGTKIMGYDMLMALMTVCRIKQTTTKKGTLKKWDGEARVDMPATLIPEFEGKEIGVLLQKEEYLKDDGNIGFSMKLYMPFDPKSRCIAAEILNGEEIGSRLDKIKLTLKDQTVTPRRPAYAPPVANKPATQEEAPPFEDDLDVPF